MTELNEQIGAELRRVVGPAGYELRFDTQPDGKVMVRMDAAEAVWGMCPDDLLQLLREMPDRAGLLALRQAVDQHPHKLTCA
ncbi:MAG TPA: hypothetical protein VJ783_16440 [Pirellulales bacterium]|nr:hypothetical protein [Pirellulales bacterium]